MKQICLYFEVHIPYTLKRYRFFEIGNDHYYYDDFANEDRVRYLAEKSFLPANNILLELIKIELIYLNKQIIIAYFKTSDKF